VPAISITTPLAQPVPSSALPFAALAPSRPRRLVAIIRSSSCGLQQKRYLSISRWCQCAPPTRHLQPGHSPRRSCAQPLASDAAPAPAPAALSGTSVAAPWPGPGGALSTRVIHPSSSFFPRRFGLPPQHHHSAPNRLPNRLPTPRRSSSLGMGMLLLPPPCLGVPASWGGPLPSFPWP
jgi:hypothetical protein